MKSLMFTLMLLFFSSANAAITIKDSLASHTFEQAPQRVIALDWASVENLIELEITPIAIADTADYRTWVMQPPLPDNIIDVGTRDAPSLERIAQLQPDLIVIGGHQAGLKDKLQKIAPVLLFDGYNRNQNNYEAAYWIFLELAKLFDKQALAEQKLAIKAQRIELLKSKLNAHFNNQLPKVAPIRFNNSALLWVFGDNAMPQYALELLGIDPALPQPASAWGVTQKKVVELAKVDDGVVLYFEPFDQKQKLFNTPLWKAMPFVRQQRLAAVPPTWTYGGPISVQYLAEAMTEQLLKMEP